MINDLFLKGLAKLGVGESFSIPSHLAFGSDSADLSATDIITSGEFDRNVLTSVYSDDFVMKFVGGRTAAEANGELIQNVGLHNTGVLQSSGDLLANFLVASLLHTTDFDVEVEFWVEVKRS